MPCPICNYNMVKEIDRALLAGVSVTTLKKRYSFSAADLERHREHLTAKMAQASKRFHDNLHLGLFCKLSHVMEMMLYVVRGAKTGGDFKFFLQASREFSRIVKLMDKMAAKLPLDPEFIYCLIASHQWDLQEESLLPHAFKAMSDTRHTLKVNIFSHCPEPEPNPNPATAQNTTQKTRNGNLEVLAPAAVLADPNPADAVTPSWFNDADDDPKSKPEKHSQHRRDNSEKIIRSR